MFLTIVKIRNYTMNGINFGK